MAQMIGNICKLRDVCKKIGSGSTPKGGSLIYLRDGIGFIRSQNVYNNFFEYSGYAHISDAAAAKLSSVEVYENDVLLNITGDSVARCCLVPKEALPARVNQHVAIIRTDNRILNPRFLMYYMISPEMQAIMLGLAVGKGASRNALTKGLIEDFDIPLPDIATQNKIVELLSAYDTLIENNRKQIKLLEEAARRLYKEWFVDLRFPGHEHTTIVNGIPEGWTMLQTADVITFDPSVKLEKGQTRENVPMTALSTSGCTLDKSLITRTTSCSGSRFQNGDTLLARISPSLENGKTAYVQGLEGPAVGSTEYIVMRGKSIPSIMVYLYARTEHFRKVAIGSMKGSDGRQRAQKDMLTSLPYVKASDTLLKDFEGIAQPMFTLIEQLCTYNQHLTEARDRLLPKLMSGEIAIK